jgi:hypothetical protein
MFTVAWDASYLLLSHIVQDFIFKGPGLALSHFDRVEHGVLAQKQSDGFVMLVKAHHYVAQFGLLFIQELSTRLHPLHPVSIFLYTSRFFERPNDPEFSRLAIGTV